MEQSIYTYDRNDIIVNVNVTKNIDNDLVAQVVYKKEGQDVTANPTFVNTYTAPKPAKANFTVTKEYNDSEGEARAKEANQFRFMLTGKTERLCLMMYLPETQRL